MTDYTIAGQQIPAEALRWKFVRSTGPGGQNVNKVATAAELRLDLSACRFSTAYRRRLALIAGKRLTRAGEIVIFAQAQRTQGRNREDAMDRLGVLLSEAGRAPKKRLKTKPSRKAVKARIKRKQRLGQKKQLRRKPLFD